MRWNELDEEHCSIARTLSIIGDRWTLLILRECFMRVRRFEYFQNRLGITRHVLADRLRKLVEAGLLVRVPYQERPLREEYRLTEKGLDIYPVLMSILSWGDRWRTDSEGVPVLHRHLDCGHHFRPVVSCSECGEPLDPRRVSPEPGPGITDEAALRYFTFGRHGSSGALPAPRRPAPANDDGAVD
ncbi:helix-turn-helix domain-containing protein [Tistrella mobilis]|uniref:winged helix-turn-helix transcriptional regulator n=1 Tax=Tistrella mobilis TaxID=171437 RepID=UPI003557A14A